MSPLDAQTGLLGQLLDATALRQQAISQNLANVNSPGYQRLEVSFEDQFKQALAGGDAASAGRIQPKIQQSKDPATRSDGSNVDLDKEMGELQRTSLMFQTLTKVLEMRLGMMRRAMEGR